MEMEGFEWPITSLWQRRDPGSSLFALIILNQPLKNDETLQTAWTNSCIHVAADGGANHLYRELKKGRKGKAQANTRTGHPLEDLQVIIGDLDSLDPEVRTVYSSWGTKIIQESEQESTDFAKAVSWIRLKQPNIDIVAIGGVGGRVDQGLSQLHHLYLFQKAPDYSDGRLFLLTEESLVFLLKVGKHKIRVRDGGPEIFDKYVGIIPLNGQSVITTRGLKWDVTDWETEIGGRLSTSNHLRPEVDMVEVETTKDVLFTIALKKSSGDNE